MFSHIVLLRERSKSTTAAEKGKIILSRIKKVIDIHFPALFQSFNDLTDRRKREEYSMTEFIAGALFMYIFKETSRYFHYVLDARLVTSTGLAISLASEFIENTPGRDFQKQECEQKAFVRLAAKIKKHFPRLPICILADGLYPNNTVFDICDINNWQFIITLKDRSLKTFQTEANLLKATAPLATAMTLTDLLLLMTLKKYLS